MKKSEGRINLEEIIHCLGTVTMTLRQNSKKALSDLRALGQAIDDQVPYRDGHSLRVTDYCMTMADYLGFDDNEKVVLEVAALLHDFGKIGIDEAILMKPQLLTPEEKLEIDMHVMRGYYMLAGFNELIEALRGIKSHHESYDGTGYPEGLAKSQIPLIGRIIAVADAYDAMTSRRPYRKALTHEQAVHELKSNAGTQFDPAIVKIFIKYLSEKKPSRSATT
jgi:HD-GYP domain-containing protein (c-di-GMP phosphodiesterase class II)